MISRILTHIVPTILLAALILPVALAAQQVQYQVIDMGTLGGPVSASGQGLALSQHGAHANWRGVTIGWSATSNSTSSTSNPIVCGGVDGVVPYITVSFEWYNGVFTDLGALPGGNNCSEPFWLNDKGEIVGTSENGKVDPYPNKNQTRAVVWKDGQIRDLGSFGGYQNAAQAINNHDQVAGFSLNTTPDPYSINEVLFLGAPTGTQTRAFLWEKGTMKDLGTLGGDDAGALLINKNGQIAGESYTSTIPDPVTGFPPIDPFLWEGDTMTDIGTFGGAIGFPTFLNNNGQVIGVSSPASDPGACFSETDRNCHPFLWDQTNGMIDLNTTTTGGKPLNAYVINDSGEIIGQADFSGNGGTGGEGYLWKNGVATNLGRLQGDCFSGATFINSLGQIVGNSFTCKGQTLPHHPFLWENGTMTDLNTLIPANGPLELVVATSINDRGEISGNGVPPGVDPKDVATKGHAFLMIPCDEGGCQSDSSLSNRQLFRYDSKSDRRQLP